MYLDGLAGEEALGAGDEPQQLAPDRREGVVRRRGPVGKGRWGRVGSRRITSRSKTWGNGSARKGNKSNHQEKSQGKKTPTLPMVYHHCVQAVWG